MTSWRGMRSTEELRILGFSYFDFLIMDFWNRTWLDLTLFSGLRTRWAFSRRGTRPLSPWRQRYQRCSIIRARHQRFSIHKHLWYLSRWVGGLVPVSDFGLALSFELCVFLIQPKQVISKLNLLQSEKGRLIQNESVSSWFLSLVLNKCIIIQNRDIR